MQRKPWFKYFMEIALLVSERATCNRLKVGCVLVKEKRIIATGFNGSVSGTPHCIEEGCLVVDNHCIRTIHAEHNAILQCAKFGISTEGATMYITHFPCFHCCKLLAQAGIKNIYYLHDYNNSNESKELLKAVGINFCKLEE